MFVVRHAALFCVPTLMAVLLFHGMAQLRSDAFQAAGQVLFGSGPGRLSVESLEVVSRRSNLLTQLTITAIALIGVLSGFLIQFGSSARTIVHSLTTMAVGLYVANGVISFPTYPEGPEFWAYIAGASICAFLVLRVQTTVRKRRPG